MNDLSRVNEVDHGLLVEHARRIELSSLLTFTTDKTGISGSQNSVFEILRFTVQNRSSLSSNSGPGCSHDSSGRVVSTMTLRQLRVLNGPLVGVISSGM